MYEESCAFTIGKAITLRGGDDAAIMANGLIVSRALEAAALAGKRGTSTQVLDMHTARPLDEEAVKEAAQ